MLESNMRRSNVGLREQKVKRGPSMTSPMGQLNSGMPIMAHFLASILSLERSAPTLPFPALWLRRKHTSMNKCVFFYLHYRYFSFIGGKEVISWY